MCRSGRSVDSSCPAHRMSGAKRCPSICIYGGDGFRGAHLSYGLTTRPAQVICPSGGLLTGVSSLISDFPKNISVFTHPKSHLSLLPSRPERGAYHDRHGRWVRDAGDAAALSARWDRRAGSLGACERSQARGREMLSRTAKSCGSDAPTLASSLAEACRPNRVLRRPSTLSGAMPTGPRNAPTRWDHPGMTDVLQRLLPSPRRFGRRDLGVLCFGLVAPAQNLHRQHRMIKPLQVQIVERLAIDPGLDHAKDAPGDHDLVRFRLVAQPRGEVGDVADRGVFEPLLEADLAERGIAERDADAKSQTMSAVAPLLGQQPDGVAHLHRHLHGAPGVISKFDRRVEQDHHAIAGIAVECALVTENQFAQGGVIFAQHGHGLFGLGALGERGKAAQVAEHHRDFAAVAIEK